MLELRANLRKFYLGGGFIINWEMGENKNKMIKIWQKVPNPEFTFQCRDAFQRGRKNNNFLDFPKFPLQLFSIFDSPLPHSNLFPPASAHPCHPPPHYIITKIRPRKTPQKQGKKHRANRKNLCFTLSTFSFSFLRWYLLFVHWGKQQFAPGIFHHSKQPVAASSKTK